MNVPLFPLNAIVCPGGKLPLRIFEPRYLDMVKHCLKNDSGFVVVLLKPNENEVEVPDPSRQPAGSQGTSKIYRIGTLVKIIDFDQGEDGILNIVTQGISQVSIAEPHKCDDGLWTGDIETQQEESFVALPGEYSELCSVLQALLQHPVIKELNLDIDYEDGRQVGWRLTELLPFDNSQKQYLYEMSDPVSRLQRISDQLNVMIA